VLLSVVRSRANQSEKILALCGQGPPSRSWDTPVAGDSEIGLSFKITVTAMTMRNGRSAAQPASDGKYVKKNRNYWKYRDMEFLFRRMAEYRNF
jgi:hypothetical protein